MTDCLLDARWLNQLAGYHTLFVGYSGGLDSTVLLHNLANHPTLAGKVSAVHIHHGLSPNADAWLAQCQAFCTGISIPLIISHVTIQKHANIEASARKARYEVFEHLLQKEYALLLAHHADDQAETLLLQLFRGAGIDGLAAMPDIKPLGEGNVVRPLLQHARKSLEAYAESHQLTWVDDESNLDTAFSRNYLRHQIMPLLLARWPGVVTNLVRSAGHCQQAKINLETLAEHTRHLSRRPKSPARHPESSPRRPEQSEGSPHILEIPRFARDDVRGDARDDVSGDARDAVKDDQDEAGYAVLANLLRIWLQKNQVRMPSTHTFNRLISEIIFARQDAKPSVTWDSVCVRRYQNKLYLMKAQTASSRVAMEWLLFPDPLQMNEGYLCALPSDNGLLVPPGGKVEVRYRQGGELFHLHGQTKTLKHLLQQWQVPPWERDTLPLVYVNDELAAVVGFAINDRYYRIGLIQCYQIVLCETLHGGSNAATTH